MIDAADPVALLQALLRFDTSNPPGNERACIEFIGGPLSAAGLEPMLLARDPERPNLIVRLAGRGEARPLLLHGHVDVVPATVGDWRHDPFGGELIDNEVWGRGALDMKSGLAMFIAAMIRHCRADTPPPGDLILAVVCDEERGSAEGARFLVDEHADVFDGVRHALGEFGGFTVWAGGRRLYPIQACEKQAVVLRALLRGNGGHGAAVVRGTSVNHLESFLRALDSPFPISIGSFVAGSLNEMGRGLPAHERLALKLLHIPGIAGPVLRVFGKQADPLLPLLRDTVTPTVIRGGDVPNVIPTEIELILDARVLPDHDISTVVDELERRAGGHATIEIIRREPAVPPDPDLSLIPILGNILRELDPGCHPFPSLSPGYTDARHFARLGIQTYGFTPLRLPKGFTVDLIHSSDERVPAEAVRFGADCVFEATRRYR